MATFSDHRYYKNGTSGVSSVIGWESSSNRVLRVSFTTGDSGATSISFETGAGTISHQQGTAITSIPFYITTSSTSHANANAADGYAVTGYINKSGSKFTGSANIVLRANTKYYVWFFPKSKTYGWSYWNYAEAYPTNYTLSGTSKYFLSVSAGTGSSITVNRTSSPAGLNTGVLSNGAVICTNDKLKIEFTPDVNNRLLTTKVNDANFTSGNTHTVVGNVSVTSTAQVLASSVGAADANIGSTSTITVTKYDTSYYHSLQYRFGTLTGYITSSGEIQSAEVKFANTSVSFPVPTIFYSQIPDDQTGICTIICRTYSSSTSATVLGHETTCTFIVTATGSPTVSGTVTDTNATTVALTGDPSRLIRYMSKAVATIDATARNSASISSKLINNVSPNASNQRTFNNVSTTSFVFMATDSRGYSSSTAVSPTMVAYIKLTLNPEIRRPHATGSEMTLSMNGNYYRGSFGSYSNTLTISYRYREATEAAYGDWVTIPTSSYTINSNTYSGSGISLGTHFDYQKSYIFQIKAVDGTQDYPLMTVTKEVSVQRGIPVFDWGENDFDFHVPVKISNGGTFTIGSTTITEAQLKSLLALIS